MTVVFHTKVRLENRKVHRSANGMSTLTTVKFLNFRTPKIVAVIMLNFTQRYLIME